MDKRLKNLVGGRFVNGGRQMATGLDCWGLVMEVYKRLGITIPDFTVDAFAFKAVDALANKSVKSKVWEEVYAPTVDDIPLVVLMRIHPGLITHAGVLVERDKIIHTMKMTGCITSRVVGLQSRIAGYYRYADNN